MNYRNENKISDKEILQNICKKLSVSIVMLSEELKINKASLYEVTNGRNCLSDRIKNSIIKKFKNVNQEYLEYGIGEVLIKKDYELKKEIEILNKKIDDINKKIDDFIIKNSEIK
jgi:hypothetical protein